MGKGALRKVRRSWPRFRSSSNNDVENQGNDENQQADDAGTDSRHIGSQHGPNASRQIVGIADSIPTQGGK
jgi:hypothetical protein